MTEIAGRWLRVSRTGQDEASQEPEVDGWIAAKGYRTGPTYRLHGDSAYHGKQEPELRRAMADMQAGRISVLVAWKSDRIERRGAYELMGLLREAHSYGGRIEFADEEALNVPSGISGDMMLAFFGSAAYHESKTKSDRIKAKHAALRASGSWCNGRAPYGYEIVTLADGRKTLAPREDEAPHVTRIFELAAQGRTCLEIARALDADGVPTRERLANWTEGTINKILRSPNFRGEVVGPNGRPYMTVPALTTPGTWLAANEALITRSKSTGRGSKGRTSTAYLRPVCARCGAPMYKTRESYRCVGRTNSAALGEPGNAAQRKPCSLPLGGRRASNTIRADVLNSEVLAYFGASDEPEILETLIPGTDYSEEIASVRLAIKGLDDMADDYDEQHAALRAELRRLRSLPAEPARVEERATGRTEGQAFAALDRDAQRAWIHARYEIRVYPEPTLWHGRATRWTAGYKGHRLTEAQAKDILTGALEGLKA